MNVGNKFSSFEDLVKAIRSHEKSTFPQLYVRSSRSIETAAKRATKKVFKAELKYAEIDYSRRKNI